MSADLRPKLEQLVGWFETMTAASALRAAEFYAPDAQFRDPFNEVTGAQKIARIYAHLFSQVSEPRFVVLERFVDGDSAMLLWEMHYRSRPGAEPSNLRGTTHLRFDAQGRVVLHHDYWDPAGQLYGRIPLLGGLLRRIAARLRAPQ